MKVQSLNNYDCQRKKDVSFEALQNSAGVLRTGMENAQRPIQVYRERGFNDFIQHPIKFLRNVIWTVFNKAIALHNRLYTG